MSMIKHFYHDQIAYAQDPWYDADPTDELYADGYNSRDSAALCAFMPNILDPDFEYRSKDKTDVQRTWARYGWEPPCKERQREIRLKLNRIE